MKKINICMLFVALFATTFISCTKEEIPGDEQPETVSHSIAYVVNYGNYTGSKTTIDIYDTESNTITPDAYKNANSVALTSNVQSMAIHKDIAYLMSNNGDKIDIVDAKTMAASVNPISADITKPRYFTAKENTAYVSCWGDVQNWDSIANSYIAKIDLTTKAVTKITLPGGPEGVIIVNNKLYAGLCTTNKVAVMDLATEEISYIEVSAVPQQFVQDGDGNIWVSLVTKYSTPFPEDHLGVAVINPATDTVTDKVDFAGIGGNGYIHISGDKKTIYVMGNEAYPGTASTIYALDVADRRMESSALVSGEQFYGFNVNPEDDNIYVLISPSVTENGSLKIYSSSGELLDEEETGVGPQHVVFYDIVEEVE